MANVKINGSQISNINTPSWMPNTVSTEISPTIVTERKWKKDKRSNVPFKFNSEQFDKWASLSEPIFQNFGTLIGADAPGIDTNIGNQKALSSTVKQFGNIGKVAGLAMDAMMGLEGALGITQNTIDDNQAERAGIGGFSKGLNNLTASIPGFGALAALISGKTKTAQKGEDVENIRSAYSGSLQDLDAAESMSGKNYMFGTKKMNKFIEEMNRNNKILQDISSTNTLRKQSQYGDDLAQQNLNRYAGNNYSYLRAAKQGMKLPSIKEVQKILALRKIIESFQNGGALPGIDVNVIPEGKHHIHKNNLDKIAPELGELTPKGIPVITTDENGQVTQVAEIEVGEIILTKDLTEIIEKLRDNGSEEAMIEAGKIFTNEIIMNTQNNTENANIKLK